MIITNEPRENKTAELNTTEIKNNLSISEGPFELRVDNTKARVCLRKIKMAAGVGRPSYLLI